VLSLFDIVFTCVQFSLLEDLHGSYNFSQVVCSLSLICERLINFTQNLYVLISLSSGFRYARFIWFRVCVCSFYFTWHLCVFPGFVCAQFILFMIFVCSINCSEDLCARSLFARDFLCAHCILLRIFVCSFYFAVKLCVLFLFCSGCTRAHFIFDRAYMCSAYFYSWFVCTQLILFTTNVWSLNFFHGFCVFSSLHVGFTYAWFYFIQNLCVIF